MGGLESRACRLYVLLGALTRAGDREVRMEVVKGHVWVRMNEEWCACWECRRFVPIELCLEEVIEWPKGAAMIQSAKTREKRRGGAKVRRRRR